MARYKSEKIKIIKEIISDIVVETMTLNSFLSNFGGGRNKNLDKVIVKWFMKKDNSNPKKSKENWEKIVKSFSSEIE